MCKNSCIWVHRTDVRQQPFSLRQKAEILKQILNKPWWWWQAMAPHPIPLPCALAFPPPSHRDATTPSPCWAPHFMTQERIMFSNPTPSEPRMGFPAFQNPAWVFQHLFFPQICFGRLQKKKLIIILYHKTVYSTNTFRKTWFLRKPTNPPCRVVQVP